VYRTGAIGPIRLSVRVYTPQTTPHDPDRSRRELYSIAGGSQAPNPNVESCLAGGRPIREPLSQPDLPIRNRRISRRGVIDLEFNRQVAKREREFNRQDAKSPRGRGNSTAKTPRTPRGEGLTAKTPRTPRGKGLTAKTRLGGDLSLMNVRERGCGPRQTLNFGGRFLPPLFFHGDLGVLAVPLLHRPSADPHSFLAPLASWRFLFCTGPRQTLNFGGRFLSPLFFLGDLGVLAVRLMHRPSADPQPRWPVPYLISSFLASLASWRFLL